MSDALWEIKFLILLACIILYFRIGGKANEVLSEMKAQSKILESLAAKSDAAKSDIKNLTENIDGVQTTVSAIEDSVATIEQAVVPLPDDFTEP
jgi:prophage DNA circulation protein